jgi:Insulin-induced protein (INSIG)
VNPFLWYLIDRTKTGFWLSTVVALTGMSITLALHPEIIPSSSSSGLGLRNWRLEYDVEGGLTQDASAVAVWLASVFYTACVCFGNIGRQLALIQLSEKE